MFRASSVHLQEDSCIHAAYGTVITSKPCFNNTRPLTFLQSDSTMCCMYTMYPPEDEHLWLETCRGI